MNAHWTPPKRGPGNPGGTNSRIINIGELPPEFIARIDEEAKKRGLTRTGLCRRLMEQIADDNLFDAVLDDA